MTPAASADPAAHRAAGTAPRGAVLVGRESVGKSQLLASLTGAPAYVANYGGSTVACEQYAAEGWLLVDTPGILYAEESEATRETLRRLGGEDVILLVVQGTHLREDLAAMLPLVAGRRGAVVATFWDRVDPGLGAEALTALRMENGLEVIPVDGRALTEGDRARIWSGLDRPRTLPGGAAGCVRWRVDAPPSILERGGIGRLLAAVLLLLPAFLAVAGAYLVSTLLERWLEAPLGGIARRVGGLPAPVDGILTGDYGLLTMTPLLLVWALPTLVIYAFLLGIWKASGLAERIGAVLHPWVRRVGMGGRDLVRIVMGFGCNVPAVTSTRGCASCTRGTCVSAIAFGSACSYQLGATLGVFSAAEKPWLAGPYLVLLGISTLLYARAVSPAAVRSPLNVLVAEHRTFLVRPRWDPVWREARGTLHQFLRQALPVFLAITVTASLLAWAGILQFLAILLSPFMALFRLPPEAAAPIVLAAVRKDGILLFAEPTTLAALSTVQLLVAVYLAGVLLPCLVTVLTIGREMSWRFAGGLLLRQAAAASLFSLVVAWSAWLLALRL